MTEQALSKAFNIALAGVVMMPVTLCVKQTALSIYMITYGNTAAIILPRTGRILI